MKARRTVPKFATEAQEAQWWDDNRHVVEQNLLHALADGSAARGTALRLTREARGSKGVAIRIPIDEIERARRLAQRKRMGYQALIRALLHDALARQEEAPAKRSAGGRRSAR